MSVKITGQEFLLCWKGRKEGSHAFSLLAEPALEIGLEDLHNGDESLHLLKSSAELRFTGPGALEPSLGLGEPASQIFDHQYVVVCRTPVPRGA